MTPREQSSRKKFPRQAAAVTRMELIAEVASVVEVSDQQAAFIVESILGSIAHALQRGDRVEVRGFGSFGTRQRGPRTGRNPKTGTRVAVAPKKVPFFKPAKEVRDLLEKLHQAGETNKPPGVKSGSKMFP